MPRLSKGYPNAIIKLENDEGQTMTIIKNDWEKYAKIKFGRLEYMLNSVELKALSKTILDLAEDMDKLDIETKGGTDWRNSRTIDQ